jgi:hypothetical protein
MGLRYLQFLDFGFNGWRLFSTDFDQLTDCIGRLRALSEPIPNAVHIQLNLSGFPGGVVGAEILEIGTIAL